MPLSSFTGLPLLPDPSDATPGLFNARYSILSQNLDQLNAANWSNSSLSVQASEMSHAIVTQFLSVTTSGLSSHAMFTLESRDTSIQPLRIFSLDDSGTTLYQRITLESNPTEPVDLNFRNVVVNMGSNDPAVSQNVSMLFVSHTQSFSPIQIFQQDSLITQVWFVGNSGTMTSRVGGVASTAWQVEVAGHANPRMRVDEFGAHTWGAGGGSAVDVTLEREVGGLKITSGATFGIRDTFTPAAGTSSGTTGDIVWDTAYVYICTSTDSWSRATLETF